jgi:hypothetical protein
MRRRSNTTEERKRSLREFDLLVVAIVGVLMQLHSVTGPSSGLLTVLGVMIGKTGVTAFCRGLGEIE